MEGGGGEGRMDGQEGREEGRTRWKGGGGRGGWTDRRVQREKVIIRRARWRWKDRADHYALCLCQYIGPTPMSLVTVLQRHLAA